MIKQHSCLSPFEKRAMDRELRQIGLTGVIDRPNGASDVHP